MAQRKVVKKTTKKAPSKRKTVANDSTEHEPAKVVIPEIVDEHEEPQFAPPDSELEAEPESDADRDEDDAESETSGTDAESPRGGSLPVPSSEGNVRPTSDALSIYLSQLRRYPVLDRAKEQEVARRFAESKNPEDAQLLVQSNLRFVVKVAAEYSKFGARLIDLIQEGNVGLMHAVKEFNPYKGTRLITYAVWWIRGYIQEYLMRQYSMVRIGTTQNQRKLFYQLQKQREALEAMGEHPDFKMLSTRLGVPEHEIQDMAQRLKGRDISLDRPVDDETSARLGDLQTDLSTVPVDERLALAEQLSMLTEKIDEIRPTLNEREVILLDERLLADDPLTLQEIGEKYGITREAVRQAEVRLMKKIRDKMTELQGTAKGDS